MFEMKCDLIFSTALMGKFFHLQKFQSDVMKLRGHSRRVRPNFFFPAISDRLEFSGQILVPPCAHNIKFRKILQMGACVVPCG